MKRVLGILSFSFSVILFTACGSTVVPDDDDGECCLAEPVCPEGATEVPTCSTEDCFEVEACCSSILCEPAPPCPGYPSCDVAEEEVPSCEGIADCRPVTLCGTTIYCQGEIFCGEVPSCDPGDSEVDSCVPDAPCYQVEACGLAITCEDIALPQHGCPETVPPEDEPCDQEGTLCDYPSGGDCFDTYACEYVGEYWAWEWVGGGCGV